MARIRIVFQKNAGDLFLDLSLFKALSINEKDYYK
jgi:hypothetical protein